MNLSAASWSAAAASPNLFLKILNHLLLALNSLGLDPPPFLLSVVT